MGGLESWKDVLVMVGLNCIYAGFGPLSKAAFQNGLNPLILVVYRQAIATLAMAPLAVVARKKNGSSLRLDGKTLALIFSSASFGMTGYQITYYEGLNLSSPTIASAMINLSTAITFLMAVIGGVERVDVLSLRGAAKVFGTTLCIAGAVTMSLIKGPKLLNVSSEADHSNNWLLGCLLVFSSCWCWSAYLILQVQVTKKCPDHLYSSSLTCLFGLAQSTVVAMFFEGDIQDWKLNTVLQYSACIYSGVSTMVSFFCQAWVVSRRGPVFSAAFNPLCTVLVAIADLILLQEDIYLGSLLGIVAITVGLYIFLWGKANDHILNHNRNDLQESFLTLNDDDISNPEQELRSQLLILGDVPTRRMG